MGPFLYLFAAQSIDYKFVSDVFCWLIATVDATTSRLTDHSFSQTEHLSSSVIETVEA